MISSNNPVLFDSNILIWAQDTKNTHHQKAKELVKLGLTRKTNVCLTHQNLLEFLSIVTNPKRVRQTLTLAKTLRIIENYLKYFKILSPKEDALNLVLRLIRSFKIKKARAFDAYLVATMVSNKVFTLYTANDRDFKKFADKIKIVNPFKSSGK